VSNWQNTFKTQTIDSKQLLDKYDKYAEDFDQHVKNELCGNGENTPVVVTAKVFSQTVPYQDYMKILDVGAGTGEQGEQLAKHGYKNVEITAFDPSEGMLNVAKKRNIYSEFIQGSLPDSGLPSNYFDAIICVGTFTPGHAPAESLRELVRITKQGGYIVYSVRKHFYEDLDSRFQAVEEELTKAKKWKMIAKREDEYLPAQNIKGSYFSFQVID
jgi:ubiquinone/menaquinone biosynthesis C-methylase UbiE